MAEKKNDYYVHVSDANALLKKVLLSSKLVVSSSQSYYKTLEIRREKTILFSKLRSEVKDLLQLSKQLESSLPYKELIAIEKKKLSKPKQKPMKPKVLIVEDDMMMRTVFELYIEQCGFELIGVAADVETTMQILSANIVDIVLIDIHLKQENEGLELSKIIEKKYNLPIIFISADPNENIIEKAINNNVFGFLHKPIHKNNLKSTIFFALYKHKLLKK